MLTHVILTTPCKIETIIVPILRMRKLKPREIICPKSYITNKDRARIPLYYIASQFIYKSHAKSIFHNYFTEFWET